MDEKRELFSHFVVVVNNETGKMWLDNDTLSAHFEGDAIWDETNSEWLNVDELTDEEGNKDNSSCNAVYQLIEKHNKELETK